MSAPLPPDGRLPESGAASGQGRVPGARFEELDALRGVAALIVVFHHLILSFVALGAWRRTPLYAGKESVIFFFLLSGFVLALPFQSRRVSPLAFCVKRLCRIWIPYAASIVAASALYFLTPSASPQGTTYWFAHLWRIPPRPGFVLQHVLMNPLGRSAFRELSLNPVIWSLNHEMRVSLVFPLLMAALPLWPARYVIGGVAASSVVGLALYRYLPFANDYALTLHYAAMFVVGALIAFHRERLAGLWSGLPRIARGAVLLAACAVYFNSLQAADFLAHGHEALRQFIGEWPLTLAAAIFLLAALVPSTLQAGLRHPLLVHLGRISYSLYLCHLLIVIPLIRWWGATLPLGVLLTLAVILSLVTAELGFRLIELPAQRLGRYLASRMASDRPGRVAADASDRPSPAGT